MQQVVIVIICLLLYLAFKPVVLSLIQTRNFQTCQNNIRKISQGIRNYAEDWDETLPPASIWQDAAESNISATSGTGFTVDSYFHCPLDKSGKPCSYCYNSWLGGLSLITKPENMKAEERLKEIGRLDHAVLIIEKFGGERNQNQTMKNWNDVIAVMNCPHNIPDPTGSLIYGSLEPGSKNKEELGDYAGRRF